MGDNYDLVGIDISGIQELIDKFDKLPQAAKDGAVDEVSPYLLNVMRAYPSYKHVTYKAAYGGFKSDKQRRFVMANIRNGTITPGKSNRTQQLSRGWVKIGSGQNTILANETPYAKWMYDDGQQANMPRMIGWKTLGATLKEKSAQIMRRADAGIKKALHKLGL